MLGVCKCRGKKKIGKSVFFFQAEDGIRDAQESRGLGDVYKRQVQRRRIDRFGEEVVHPRLSARRPIAREHVGGHRNCLL